ncbi:MAG: MerR family transcriptional regulator, light-induced transcriptional regulator [Actinomycetota bacterium]
MSVDSADSDALRTARLAMLAALIDGDVKNARELALRLLEDGYAFDEIVEGVFAPVQGEFGRRWASGDLGVADEHAASEAVAQLITHLSAVAETPTGPKVVAVAPEHDAHGLGARVVTASLVLEGFDAVFLGASLPPEDLGDYLRAQEPYALILSCSVTAALASAARSVAAAHDEGIAVIAGGSALPDEERATRIGADSFARSARDVTLTLHDWAQTPPSSLQVAPDPIPEQRSLWTRSAAVVAAAMASASERAERPDRLADEMRWLLLVLESSVLLGEPNLLVEHLEWLRSVAPTHGVGRDTIDAGISALVDALDGDLGRLGRALATAYGVA